jgi:hypothetical protein
MKTLIVLFVLFMIGIFVVLPIGLIVYFVKRRKKPSVRKDQIMESW